MGSVYTVSQVTSYIKNMFTQDFALNRVSIKGEVSNCKYHTSGHIYFTLKDGGAQIAAVMFAGQRKGLDFTLAEGQEVIVSGTVDVYEKDGRYQLYAKEIKREGRGDLPCGISAEQYTYYKSCRTIISIFHIEAARDDHRMFLCIFRKRIDHLCNLFP